ARSRVVSRASRDWVRAKSERCRSPARLAAMSWSMAKSLRVAVSVAARHSPYALSTVAASAPGRVQAPAFAAASGGPLGQPGRLIEPQPANSSSRAAARTLTIPFPFGSHGAALFQRRQQRPFFIDGRLVPAGDLVDGAQAAATLPGRRIDHADANARRHWRPLVWLAAAGGHYEPPAVTRSDRVVRSSIALSGGIAKLHGASRWLRALASASPLSKPVASSAIQLVSPGGDRRSPTISPSKVVNDAVATPAVGTGSSTAGFTSSRSSAASAAAGAASIACSLNLAPSGAPSTANGASDVARLKV